MTNRLLRSILAPAAVLVSAACVDLEVTNPNNPDITRALSSPEDVVRVASSSVRSWYMTASHYEPNMMLQVTADAATANYGNFGMRFNNEEPRIPYGNSSAGGDELAARRPWQNYYSALGAANDAIGALDAGVVIDGGTDANERVRAAALFTQAAAHMNLGLLFDQAFIVTAPPDPSNLPTLQPYGDVLAAALGLWDDLIALTAGKTWAWDPTWFPLHDREMDAATLNRVANTMAARTLVLGARTAADNAATNWAQVLAYADNGITGGAFAGDEFDFAITDDYNVWWDYTKNFGNLDSWTRVDQRLINRMDPTIPANFTGIPNQPESTAPLDDRLGPANGTCGGDPTDCLVGVTTDYVDLRTTIGDPGRGIWMQSTFYHARYRNSSFAVPASVNIGLENIHVSQTENNLMIAEALARTGGDLTRAAALVNNTRVTRGGLAPVAADANAILAAIEYERDVELLNTGAVSLYDRRRIDGIQVGTWRHLPVPARELEVLGLPIYTFGGAAEDPTGIVAH